MHSLLMILLNLYDRQMEVYVYYYFSFYSRGFDYQRYFNGEHVDNYRFLKLGLLIIARSETCSARVCATIYIPSISMPPGEALLLSNALTLITPATSLSAKLSKQV